MSKRFPILMLRDMACSIGDTIRAVSDVNKWVVPLAEEINSLLARAEAAEKRLEWQPISHAPTGDNNPILADSHNFTRPIVCYRGTDGDCYHYGTSKMMDPQPTHWIHPPRHADDCPLGKDRT